MAHAEDVEHGLALALGGRCPSCAEISPDAGVLSLRPCVVCGGVFATPQIADALVDEYAARSRERLALHLVALGAAGLVLGFVPLLGAACLAVGFVFFQLRVVTPALALFSRKRRAVARWTLRLLTATLGVLSAIGLTIASLAGVGGLLTSIGAPLTLGVTWLASRTYLLVQLRRERAGTPVAGGEIALLVTSLAVLVLAAVAAVALVALAASLVQMAIAKVQGWL